MLNQLGTHKKIPIDYAYTREGLDHDPTFTVECSGKCPRLSTNRMAS